ncbi:MAG: sulfotransferase domain-containing protein [Gemmatimonadota bacterium]|nr:sulfotransferase domain-containing protein [Gemmatimonadota bacterium]
MFSQNPPERLSPIIVSSPLPNGVMFLSNILMELDIPVYCQDYNAFWSHRNGEIHLKSHAFNYYRQTLPAFAKKQVYPNRSPIAVELIHEWPATSLLNRKIIFFVRDGRDGLYSLFKRKHKNGSFEDFLNKPIPPFNLNQMLTWSLYHSIWNAFMSVHTDCLLVRFEEIKTDSLNEVVKVLNFLGVERPHEEILEAIVGSGVEVALKNFQRHAVSNAKEELMRKGKVFEWKETWPEALLKQLPVTFRSAFHQLGYNGFPSVVSTNPEQIEIDVEKIALKWFRELFAANRSDEEAAVYDALRSFVEHEDQLKKKEVLSLIDGKTLYNPDFEYKLEYHIRKFIPYYQFRRIRKHLFSGLYLVLNLLERPR